MPDPALHPFAPPVLQPLSRDDPQRVGPYRLLARIGSGGMGRVYLARTAGNRPLAVKVVRPEFAGDAEFRSRFRQEVAAARRVHGMYTAEVVDADVDGPQPWLATVYVPGPSVQDVVAEHGAMPAGSVRSLAIGLAEALKVVHAAGVIHRDLKPSNVVLASDGPRVIDFGIARAVDATTMTRTGIAIGSPRFMSPEQVNGEPVTPASDVFALGAMIVFAGTGHSPFGEGATPAVLYRIVHDSPVLDGLPTDLRELALACLDKEPDNRPSSDDVLGWPFAADQAATTVVRPDTPPDRPTLVDSTVGAWQPPPTKEPRPPARTRPRRPWEVLLAVAAAGVVLSLILAILLLPTLHRDASTSSGPADVRYIATLAGDTGGIPLAFSPDGRTLAATGAGNVVNLWNAVTGTPIASMPGHTAKIRTLAFTPDGHVLTTGDVENHIRLWDVATHQLITATDIRADPAGSLTLVSVTLDGRPLAVTQQADGATRVWDVATGQMIGWFDAQDNSCPAAALRPDGRTLASARCRPDDGGVLLWRTGPDYDRIGTLTRADDVLIRDMAFSPDGRLLAVVEHHANEQAHVSLTDMDYDENVSLLDTDGNDVNAVAFSLDGHILAAAGTAVELWSLDNQETITGNGHRIGIELGPTTPATSVALSPDGHLLAAAGDHGTIELWDVSDRLAAIR